MFSKSIRDLFSSKRRKAKRKRASAAFDSLAKEVAVLKEAFFALGQQTRSLNQPGSGPEIVPANALLHIAEFRQNIMEVKDLYASMALRLAALEKTIEEGYARSGANKEPTIG